MSERYENLDFENGNDRFIKAKNEELREKYPTIPLLTQHWILCGQTMSGKSYLLKQYLYNDMAGVYDKVYWFCPTWEEENYKDLFSDIDKDEVFEEFTEEDMMKVFKECKDNFNSHDGDFHSLVILDDVGKVFREYQSFINELWRCRHYSCTIIASLQDVKGMTLDARSQFVCWSLWTNTSDETADRIGEATPIGKKKTKKLIDGVRKHLDSTGERGFLYINKEFGGKAMLNFDNFIELE